MTSWEAPLGFEDFVRARHVALLRFAHVLSGDRHAAEDLVQDALIRAGTSWRRIRKHDDPEGYVRRIIVNCHLNGLRRGKRERLVSEPPDRPAPAADERHDTLWELLATLPRQQRATLVLRYYADMSEAEIADTLGCAVGTVKSNAARALAKLRGALTPANRA
ncbi:SigE family RNA polymerase sigma factor [Dactylosporangium sp. NPDC000555]|uniref:SigE family RNA polymerase sigma factor n=1 Tax=Dactylosporangium sp. NPDC000555 TaxID=3154260 RepID=UPI003325FCB5